MKFNVTLVLCDKMLVSSSTLAAEIFKFSQSMAMATGNPIRDLVIRRVSTSDLAVTTSSGFEIQPTHGLQETFPSDLIHLPAIWRNPRPVIKRSQMLLDWISKQHMLNTIFTAVGTGVCFLAESGLLDNKPVTTHWHYFDQLKKSYPNVLLQRQHFTTKTGNIYCAASINAMAEIIVLHVERVFGRVIARQAQRHFFHEIRNLSSAIGYSDGEESLLTDEAIMQAKIWLQDNMSKHSLIRHLSSSIGMNKRTLNRRFKAATGQSPSDYLNEVRMNFACELLKNTDLSILEVANFSGHSNQSWFSSRFKKWSGSSPGGYRKSVRSKNFSS
ncbi:MAG: AraC family transcriptional regulator [Porticoccaceae bacterium]|nr:AraC family transcriptional regulator [Porticoccaceae bacterium]|tara:strand:+ start:4262 stop:5248 length:987 start_codon:yes stop_codon:yes gene_type:complete